MIKCWEVSGQQTDAQQPGQPDPAVIDMLMVPTDHLNNPKDSRAALLAAGSCVDTW